MDAGWSGGASGSSPAYPWGYKGTSGYQTEASDGTDSGLILCGARYYNPAQGRWMSRDPIGQAGGIDLYQYCDGDPVNNVDPFGLQTTNTAGTGPGMTLQCELAKDTGSAPVTGGSLRAIMQQGTARAFGPLAAGASRWGNAVRGWMQGTGDFFKDKVGRFGGREGAIALGKTGDIEHNNVGQLAKFAKDNGASYWKQWAPNEGWNQTPQNFMEKASNASKIYFDLRGVDMKVLNGPKPDLVIDRYTEWELWTIVNNPALKGKTEFHGP